MEERKQELLEMIEALDTKNEMNYIEGAFRFFIDNQVSDKELDFILKKNGEVLPDDFFDLPLREKKTYYAHTRTSIKVERDSYKCAKYEVFNKQYFYRLAEAAKKNKTLTADIIKYAAEVGFDLNFCVARDTEITAHFGWWREAETSRFILQDAFKDCLCIHFVQVPFAPILFFGYLRV